MSTALSELDRDRIRQEELLRAEIRKELNPPKPEPKGVFQNVWAFLNSSLGTWFLSSVVVALGAHIYQERQAAYRAAEEKLRQEASDKKARAETYERITIEIAYRLSTALSRLRATSIKYKDSVSDEAVRAIATALDPIRAPADDKTPPLYPEYKSYSGLALIAELRRHAGEAEKITLTDYLTKASGFIERVTFPTRDSHLPADKVASELLMQMAYSKWNIGFAYTKCKIEAPFC